MTKQSHTWEVQFIDFNLCGILGGTNSWIGTHGRPYFIRLRGSRL